MASIKKRCPRTCQSFVFPSWEQEVEFKGRLAVAREPHEVEWTTWDAEPNQDGGDCWQFMNEVLTNKESAPWTSFRLCFWDPDKFVAGGIHSKLVSWERVLVDHPEHQLII